VIQILFAALLSGAQAQHSNWVEYKKVDQIRKSLARYYTECGFYPEDLTKLTEQTAHDKDCKSFGSKEARRWPPPLPDTRENRETMEHLIYMPYGYHDYELSMRLFWTRD
jgi:hypothetical protein